MKAKFLGALAGICFLLLSISLGITLVSQWEGYYSYQFKRNRIPAVTGLSMGEVQKRGRALRIYLEEGDNRLINSYFNDREVRHMEDVHGLMVLKNKILLGAGLSFLALFLYGRRSKAYLKGYYWGNLWVCLGFLLLSLLIAFNFESSFIYFHQLFFTNDLWILNPKTDVMIQMLPEVFFQGMAGLVGIFILIMEGVYLVALWKTKKNS